MRGVQGRNNEAEEQSPSAAKKGGEEAVEYPPLAEMLAYLRANIPRYPLLLLQLLLLMLMLMLMLMPLPLPLLPPPRLPQITAPCPSRCPVVDNHHSQSGPQHAPQPLASDRTS
jgi:hypothetical protein